MFMSCCYLVELGPQQLGLPVAVCTNVSNTPRAPGHVAKLSGYPGETICSPGFPGRERTFDLPPYMWKATTSPDRLLNQKFIFVLFESSSFQKECHQNSYEILRRLRLTPEKKGSSPCFFGQMQQPDWTKPSFRWRGNSARAQRSYLHLCF